MDDRVLKSNYLFTHPAPLVDSVVQRQLRQVGMLAGAKVPGSCGNGEPVSDALHISAKMVPHYRRQ